MTEPEPIDPAILDRAGKVADAIQAAVSARPDVAVSLYGIGLDALSTKLRTEPGFLDEIEPWVLLGVGIFNYVRTGDSDESVDALLAGTWTLPAGEGVDG